MLLEDIDPKNCDNLFDRKVRQISKRLSIFDAPKPVCFPSEPTEYRLRCEFRIWHDEDQIDYVMFDNSNHKQIIRIQEFPVAVRHIQEVMQPLKQMLIASKHLRKQLFQVEFLATLSGDLLVTLIYHRKLDKDWEQEASILTQRLGCSLIGRSRKQKIVLGNTWVLERLRIKNRDYLYRQPESGFTQPNGAINKEMIHWLLENCPPTKTDLLELFCGIGNFTLPLANRFNRVLASEVSKLTINAAIWNIAINAVGNVELARLSSSEVASAISKERSFRRLEHLFQPLDQYKFETLLVDPPRAGLDGGTLELARQFKKILYISCNPDSLIENLSSLKNTHEIAALGFFDQFPYTDHLESGVILNQRS